MQQLTQSLEVMGDHELADVTGGQWDWVGIAAGVAGVAVAVACPECAVAGYALGVFGVEWSIWQGMTSY